MLRSFPRAVEILFRLRYRKSGEFVLGDVMEEYGTGGRSQWWVWRQLWSVYAPVSNVPGKQQENQMFSSLSNDIRYAARTLARNPGFAAIAILTVALGVGINSAVFSLLNAVALRSLPVPGAAKMVSVYQIFHGKVVRDVHGEASLFSTVEYETYRDTNHVFSGVLAYAPFLQAVLGGETPRQVFGAYTSCNYFDILGEHPALGRGFLTSDCAAPGSNAVVVLSDDLWRSAFGADPAIVGKTVILNRKPFRVAGVARAGFRGTEVVYAAFWVPFTIQPTLESDDSRVYADPKMSWLAVIGKLKDGESLTHVRADLGVIAARIDQQYPGRTTTLAIDTANFAGMPEARTLVLGVGAVILIAVAMVLLIACINLANLLLARAAGRQKEIAIRLAMGATRSRLVRQFMTENLMIALAGGVLGCLASFLSFGAILEMIARHLPKAVPDFSLNVAPDFRVLGYSLAITILTGVAFGLTPALRATRIYPSTTTAERANGFLRSGLVGGQVAACMMLLIAAGLLLRGLYAAQTIDPGFEMKNTFAVSFDLRNQGYDEARAIAFQRELKDRMGALPGVDGVAQARVTPLSDNHVGTGMTPAEGSQEFQTENNSVSPEYFSLLGIPIVHGRAFGPGDSQVAIVTESTARRFWPGADAVGKMLKDEDGAEYPVIGIARDAQVSHLGRSNESYVYLPAADKDQLRLAWLVHSKVDQRSAIRGAIHDLDPNLAFEITPLEENLEWWRTPSRIVAILAGSLGGLALLLASMGIYGVAAFAVSRRVKEIGIRMALGADGRSVRGMILRQGMRPVLIGAAVGIAGCAAVSRILAGMLFGLSAYDPIAFVGVPLLLIGIAWLATHVPAQRATKVDPMVALRYE